MKESEVISEQDLCNEETFIDDNYATRKGKGTLYGINRIYGHIRECSACYTRDCYVMKLDVRSFFMSICKRDLYVNLSEYLKANYKKSDLPALLFILHVILLDNPEKHCVRRCPRSYWQGLPVEKVCFMEMEITVCPSVGLQASFVQPLC